MAMAPIPTCSSELLVRRNSKDSAGAERAQRDGANVAAPLTSLNETVNCVDARRGVIQGAQAGPPAYADDDSSAVAVHE